MSDVVRTDASGKSPKKQTVLKNVPDARAKAFADNLMRDIRNIQQLSLIAYRVEKAQNN